MRYARTSMASSKFKECESSKGGLRPLDRNFKVVGQEPFQGL